MHRKKLLIVGVFFFLVLLFAGALFILRPKKPPEYVSPSGVISRLEGYSFSANRVEYRLPETSLDRVFRSLPKTVRQFLPKPMPMMRDIITPFFPGEPVLSCAFSVSVPRGAQSVNALRVVTADENNDEFDPVGQSAGMIGGVPIYWATEVPVFPRRGRFVTLKLKQNDEVVAQFQIRNPATGPYPQWKPTPLPVISRSNELQAALTDFKTQFQNEYTAQQVPSTICSFQLSDQGTSGTNWIPKTAEVSDATGNHWLVFWDKRYSRIEGNIQTVGFLGALWPGEDAWKLQVGFEKQCGYAENELIHFDN